MHSCENKKTGWRSIQISKYYTKGQVVCIEVQFVGAISVDKTDKDTCTGRLQTIIISIVLYQWYIKLNNVKVQEQSNLRRYSFSFIPLFNLIECYDSNAILLSKKRQRLRFILVDAANMKSLPWLACLENRKNSIPGTVTVYTIY